MKKLIFLLLLMALHLHAQIVYQPDEVDTPAEPIGGAVLLNEFIAANIQIPFSSAYKGLNKRVIVKGVVETDGSMSGLKIFKGWDTLCNQEAIRLLGLFKAWKPASVKGNDVRQQATYPVIFRSEVNPSFDSTSWAMVNYYNDGFKSIGDAQAAKYRSVLPLDPNGNIKSDIVYQERNELGKWKKLIVIPFKRKSFWYKETSLSQDSVKAFTLSAEGPRGVNYVPIVTVNENGNLLAYQEYNHLGGRLSETRYYYLNGLLKERKVFLDSTYLDTRWFRNGQLHKTTQHESSLFEHTDEIQVFTFWDDHGRQLVKEGNGWYKIVNEPTVDVPAVEQGEIVFGKRHGKWTSKLADSTIYCEELYEQGKFIEGRVDTNGETATYLEKIKQPYFKGGINALNQFLAQNVHNPHNTFSLGARPMVIISFIIRHDGKVDEFKVERGITPSYDRQALKVGSKMNGMWRPGMFRGKNVPFKYNLPIGF